MNDLSAQPRVLIADEESDTALDPTYAAARIAQRPPDNWSLNKRAPIPAHIEQQQGESSCSK